MKTNYKKTYLKEKIFFKDFIIRQKKHTALKKKKLSKRNNLAKEIKNFF